MSGMQRIGLGGPGETQSLKILTSDVQVRNIGFISPGDLGTQELFFRIQAGGKGQKESLLTAKHVGHTWILVTS